MSNSRWGTYVSVAEKRKKAETAARKLIKKGEKISPVIIDGKKIASTFWGQAWCNHLESFSDYENRLPRGRSYVRNGYVIHLAIEKGQIDALVQGSSLYKVKITIKETAKQKWNAIVKSCSGKIESVLELLQGKLSKSVMEIITNQHEGLFPLPSEIKLSCSCPDGAYMCKHVAAVMYGVGAKLDHGPELLFTLRQVDQDELITKASQISTLQKANARGSAALSDDSLQSIFGIEIESELDNKQGRKKDGESNRMGKVKEPVEKKSTIKRATRKSTTKNQVEKKKIKTETRAVLKKSTKIRDR